jgi:exopolysaccharide biosynthesis polyprenyl glycosylphosphotransferase
MAREVARRDERGGEFGKDGGRGLVGALADGVGFAVDEVVDGDAVGEGERDVDGIDGAVAAVEADGEDAGFAEADTEEGEAFGADGLDGGGEFADAAIGEGDFHEGLAASIDVHEDGAEAGAGDAELDVGNGAADGGEKLLIAEGGELDEAPFVAGDIAHEEGRGAFVAGDFEAGAWGGHDEAAGGGFVKEVAGEVVVAGGAADGVPVDFTAARGEGAGFIGIEVAEIPAEAVHFSLYGACGASGGGIEPVRGLWVERAGCQRDAEQQEGAHEWVSYGVLLRRRTATGVLCAAMYCLAAESGEPCLGAMSSMKVTEGGGDYKARLPVRGGAGLGRLEANVYSRHQRKLRLFYALADAGVVYAAFEGAYYSRAWMELARDFYFTGPVKLLVLLLSMAAFWGTALWFGLYDRLEAGGKREAVRASLQQAVFAVSGVILAQFVLRLDVSRLFFGFFAAYAVFGLVAFRWNAAPLLRWYRKRFGAQHFLWIVGTGESARKVGEAVEEAERFGLRLQGFLEKGPAPEVVVLGREYPVVALEELPRLLDKDVVDELLFAVGSERLAQLEDVFLLCDEEGVRTRVAVDFFPHVHSDLYLDQLGDAPMLTFSGAPHDEIRLLLKRSIDVALAGFFLILLAPVFGLVAALVKLTSPGPAIFHQVRCGLNGRRFRLYKFRSMVVDAESRKKELAARNERQLVFKIKNDPRLTGVGRWLRKFSIDEWPQLWNVLRGDMSLVGPRPAVPEEVEQYKRWQRRRLRMRPGLTCLWAVEGRDQVDFETWMALDMEYIDNWSLALDWKIILRTIPQVVTGKGAH